MFRKLLLIGAGALFLSPAAKAWHYDVTIQNFFFDPASLTIDVGDTVTWTNNGTVGHSSTSDDLIWDSGILAPGDTSSFAFTSDGSYPYHCTPHPFMTGTITVSAMPTYDYVVEIGDFYFNPQAIQVGLGETIRWFNASPSHMHTSTATGGLWDSGTLNPGDFYDFTFSSEGVYDYVCSFHPLTMTGTVIAGQPDSVAADIQIVDFEFVPANDSVVLGQYVRWVNVGSMIHTSTSDDGVWDSGDLVPGNFYVLQMDSAGDFGYHCTPHPFMTATLHVIDTAGATQYEYLPGDVNMAAGMWPPAALGSDVTYLVNYLRGLPSAAPCLVGGFWASADANGDCSVLGSDVTRVVNYLRGIGALMSCPAFPSAWPTPSDLPVTPPAGWPNCGSAVAGLMVPTSSGR